MLFVWCPETYISLGEFMEDRLRQDHIKLIAKKEPQYEAKSLEICQWIEVDFCATLNDTKITHLKMSKVGWKISWI